jgi:hypothetical protein
LRNVGCVWKNISHTRRSIPFLTRERLLSGEQGFIAHQIGPERDQVTFNA